MTIELAQGVDLTLSLTTLSASPHAAEWPYQLVRSIDLSVFTQFSPSLSEDTDSGAELDQTN